LLQAACLGHVNDKERVRAFVVLHSSVLQEFEKCATTKITLSLTLDSLTLNPQNPAGKNGKRSH